MPAPKISAISEYAALAALFATPAVHWALPVAWREAPVALGLDAKDVLTLLIIAGLVVVLLIVSRLEGLRKYLHRTPFYEKVEHAFFYQEDGTFTLRSLFVLNAGWQPRVGVLPAEGFLWFNRIDRDRLLYRLIRFGRRQDRGLDADYPEIRPVPYHSPRQGEGEVARLSWQASVTPEMRRFESLAYQVEVTTPGTETAAFHDDGTTLGFGVSIPTRDLSLRAYAPPGFVFEFVPPIYSLRDYDTAEEIGVAPPGAAYPTLSLDRTIVEIRAWAPRVRRRYWVHYRFVRAGAIKERAVG